MKRTFGDIPAVERLYRRNNPEIDLKAGGFDDDDDEYERRRERISEAAKKKRDRPYENMVVADNCSNCAGPLFSDSFLWNHFNFDVCDKCRDGSGEHKLIPRTEAKSLYLLKDCDLDLRKPPLRFIAKKNPHNPRYGDMKLYLKPQLEARALEIYGSFQKLEETRIQKEQLREAQSEKRFDQKIRKMRKELRGNSMKAAMQAGTSHEHTFGEEEFDERKRDFWKRCTQCEYEMRYEKL